MARKKHWSELSLRTRQLIVVGAAIEGVLKLVALVDLARRSAREVHGSKAKWAAALVVDNSAGTFPLYYLARGRGLSASRR